MACTAGRVDRSLDKFKHDLFHCIAGFRTLCIHESFHIKLVLKSIVCSCTLVSHLGLVAAMEFYF